MNISKLSHNFRQIAVSFLRYLVAGGAGFLVDYATLALCYKIFGWHYLLAASLGFSAGLIFVYWVSNVWVFNVRKLKGHRLTEFSIFTLIGLIGLLLTMGGMWFFVELVTLPPLVAKLVTTALVLLWNYGARKLILY